MDEDTVVAKKARTDLPCTVCELPTKLRYGGKPYCIGDLAATFQTGPEANAG